MWAKTNVVTFVALWAVFNIGLVVAEGKSFIFDLLYSFFHAKQ